MGIRVWLLIKWDGIYKAFSTAPDKTKHMMNDNYFTIICKRWNFIEMHEIHLWDWWRDISSHQGLCPQNRTLLREKYKNHIEKIQQKFYNWNLEVDVEYL